MVKGAGLASKGLHRKVSVLTHRFVQSYNSTTTTTTATTTFTTATVFLWFFSVRVHSLLQAKQTYSCGIDEKKTFKYLQQ